MWDTVKSLVATAAPMVGTLLGGPVGGTIGGMLASTLGVENTPEAISAEIKMNPEALTKIAQLESTERIELQKLVVSHAKVDLKEYEAQLKDVQNAREAHAEHWMPSIITLIISAMVVGMFGSLMYFDIPVQFEQVLIMISGGVMTGFGTAIAYWLGSSKGSANKNKLIKGVP